MNPGLTPIDRKVEKIINSSHEVLAKKIKAEMQRQGIKSTYRMAQICGFSWPQMKNVLSGDYPYSLITILTVVSRLNLRLVIDATGESLKINLENI